MLGITKPIATSVTQNSIPAYLREENPNLVAFLKRYYEWASKDGNTLDLLQNMVEYRDINISSDDNSAIYFTNLIVNQLADFIPATSNINRGLFASRIRDFYTAKGTLPSYEFIMNALFNSTVSIEWNSDKVFRASANSSSRNATLFIQSSTPWDSTANGSIITQVYPTTASAIVDSCVPTIVNNKVINVLTLNSESVEGDFVVDGLVQLLKNTINRSWTYVSAYYAPISYSANVLKVTIGVEIPRNYPNLIVKQIGSNFRAVITSLTSRLIYNGQYELTFTVSTQTGVLGTSDIYFVDSLIENSVFTKADYLTGFVSPSIIDISITNGGSTYDVGDEITYTSGTGSQIMTEVYNVDGGPVDTIDVITNGYGYSVGDPLISKVANGEGTGLSAIVSHIDGIDASIGTLCELAGFNIRSGGKEYYKGDLITIQGGSTPLDSRPTTFQVATINSALALNSIDVTEGGYGYQYTKVSLWNHDTNTLVSGFVATATVQNSSIQSIVVNQFPTLTTHNCVAIVNGVGAVIKPVLLNANDGLGMSGSPISASGISGAYTNSTGNIGTISIISGGINYVNPVIVVTSSIPPIRPAVFSITKDASGTITNVTVVDSGAGYPIDTSVSITEMFGSGVILETVINGSTGPITSLTLVDAGTYSTLPKCFNSPYVATSTETIFTQGLSGNGISSGSISGGPIASANVVSSFTITTPSLGSGLILDLKYHIKSVNLINSGEHYKQPVIDSTYGTGQNALFSPQIVNGVVGTIGIIQGGQGYTHATVNIIGTGIGFKGVVTLSPITPTSSTIGGAISSSPMSDNSFSGNTTLTTGLNYISNIVILDGGIGYSPSDQVVIYGDGFGASASLTILNGVVKQIIVNNGGLNYAYDTSFSYVMNPVDYPTSVAGSFTPIISNGVIKSIQITNGGSGYILLTNDLKNEDGTHLLTQDGFVIAFNSPYDVPVAIDGIPAEIIISTGGKGGVLTATVDNGGTGYFTASEITPLQIQVTTLTGYGAVIIPVLENGKIIACTILHSGFAYLSTDTITVIGGGGTSAVLTPVFNSGKLSNIIIVNGGSGYRYGTTALVVGNGKNAILSPKINTSISDVLVPFGGSGYTNPSVVINDPTGTGALATAATINGVVTSVQLISGGTGYSNPTIHLVDVTGVGAVLTPVMYRNIESLSIISAGIDYTFSEIIIVGDGTNAKASVILENDGSLFAPVLVDGGSSYVDTPNILITDISNYGAVTRVQILNGGTEYQSPPIVTIADKIVGNNVVATGATFTSWGTNIGAITGVQITQFGGDWTETPKFNFSINAIMHDNVDFKTGEIVHVAGFPYQIKDLSFITLIEDTSSFTGSISGTTLTISGTPTWPIQYGAKLSGGTTALNTTIIKQLSATPAVVTGGLSSGPMSSGGLSAEVYSPSGSIGTYQVSISQTVSSTTIKATNIADGYALFGEYEIAPISMEIDHSSSLLTEDGYEIVAEDIGYVEQEFYEIFDINGIGTPFYDAGPTASIEKVDFSNYTVELTDATDSLIFITESGTTIISESGLPLVDQISNGIYIGDVIVGDTSKSSSAILWYNRASGVAVTGGVGYTKKVLDNSVGILNSPINSLQDGGRVQDYSYTLKTGVSIDQYRDVLTRNVHPAGYEMFGDVVTGTFGGGRGVTVPTTFGVKGADSSFQTTINIKNAFVDTSILHNKNFWYWNRTKQYMYTTQSSLFSPYTFENYDINSINFISNHKPLAMNEPWVAKTYTFTGSSSTIDAGVLTGMASTAGVQLGYRLIAYNSLGFSIFRENRFMLETAIDHLLCEDASYLDTDEDLITVSSFTGNTITASKYAKETDVGTVTIVVQNIPSLRLA